MKIIPTNITGGPDRITEKRSKPVSDTMSGSQPSASENVDKITISQSGSVSDARFVEALKSRILKDVQAGVDIHKLDDLKSQIASGEYRMDPAEIVHKLIGESEE